MNKHAFTLLELIIVLALLAILASVAVARFVDLSKKAFDIQEYATIDALRSAVLLYKAQYGVWPDGNAATWNPFMLLDNAPPAINFTPNDAQRDGKSWFFVKDGDTTLCSGVTYTSVYWRIWCPHATNSEPWTGREWAYMVAPGIDAWSAGGTCDKNIHPAGSIVYIDWRIGH